MMKDQAIESAVVEDQLALDQIRSRSWLSCDENKRWD